MGFQVSTQQHGELRKKGIFLITDINFNTIDELTNWILSNRPQNKKFTILINSSGGSPDAIHGFASFLNVLKKEVSIEGIAFDTCGSAALALLKCCHRRIAINHCCFFIHHIQTKLSLNCQEFDIKKIKSGLKSSKMLEEELLKIQCKKTKINKKQWMKLADKGTNNTDTMITAQKALKIGLVDKVIKKFPVF